MRNSLIASVMMIGVGVMWAASVVAEEAQTNELSADPLVASALFASATLPLVAPAHQALTGAAKALLLEGTRSELDEKLFAENAHRVAYVVAPSSGKGSAALISSDGLAVTSAHVVGVDKQVLLITRPGPGGKSKQPSAQPAKVLVVDRNTDLALVQITGVTEPLSYFELGRESDLRVGQDVHAIGHPVGEAWTYTKGIISQIHQRYEWNDKDGRHTANVIQTQTPIGPGNSGGPLFNATGQLVGINAFVSPESRGPNYAISVSEIALLLKTKRSSDSATTPEGDGKVDCSETYDGTGKGWANISACYAGRREPPPDFWLVYKQPRANAPDYVAVHDTRFYKDDGARINSVRVKSQLPEWLLNEIDIDCDGVVDLVGYEHVKDAQAVRYELAPSGKRLSSLATELAQAVAKGVIPISKLRLCGADRE